MAHISLTHLEALVMLKRDETLSAAAEKLGYSVGALSQQLSALERAVGVDLVRRSGRRLLLTGAGRLLAQSGEEMLALERSAVRALQELDNPYSGRLRIGTWGSSAAALLAPAVARAAVERPGLRIESVEIDVDGASAAVAGGQVDVAFGLDYSNVRAVFARELLAVRLFAEPLFIVGGVSDDAGLADPARAHWVLPPADSRFGHAVREACRDRGYEPIVRHQVTDTAASLYMASVGLGLTAASELMMTFAPRVPLRRAELQPGLSRELVLVMLEAGEQSTTIQYLVDLLRETISARLSDDALPSDALPSDTNRGVVGQ